MCQMWRSPNPRTFGLVLSVHEVVGDGLGSPSDEELDVGEQEQPTVAVVVLGGQQPFQFPALDPTVQETAERNSGIQGSHHKVCQESCADRLVGKRMTEGGGRTCTEHVQEGVCWLTSAVVSR